MPHTCLIKLNPLPSLVVTKPRHLSRCDKMLVLPPFRHMFFLFPTDFQLHFPTEGVPVAVWQAPPLCQEALKNLQCLHMAPKNLCVVCIGPQENPRRIIQFEAGCNVKQFSASATKNIKKKKEKKEVKENCLGWVNFMCGTLGNKFSGWALDLQIAT